MSDTKKTPIPSSVEQSQPTSSHRYSSAAQAAADDPEAEAEYYKQLKAWVEDKDKVYPGQAGTIGYADFRPTVGLARSTRYWDNMTDDAESKRLEEDRRHEEQVARRRDGPPDYATAVSKNAEGEPKERRESKIMAPLKKIFKRDRTPEPGKNDRPEEERGDDQLVNGEGTTA